MVQISQTKLLLPDLRAIVVVPQPFTRLTDNSSCLIMYSIYADELLILACAWHMHAYGPSSEGGPYYASSEHDRQ